MAKLGRRNMAKLRQNCGGNAAFSGRCGNTTLAIRKQSRIITVTLLPYSAPALRRKQSPLIVAISAPMLSLPISKPIISYNQLQRLILAPFTLHNYCIDRPTTDPGETIGACHNA
jgi:hypothetical protein